MWHPPDIQETASNVAQSLAKGDVYFAFRHAARFFEFYVEANWDERARMVADRPESTGSSRWDAMLAGVVEYSCAVHGVKAPEWVLEPEYFLREFWFVAGFKSLEADAIVHSPISFKRRGVFLTEGALNYA